MNSVSLDGKPMVPSKIVCAGINYLSHIEEMGGRGPAPEPVLFFKPNSSIHSGDGEVFIPDSLGLLHHEIEWCVMVDGGHRDMSPAEAEDRVLGHAVGLDFTLRDRQAAAKASGRPWDLSKGFDHAACFGPFVSKPRSFLQEGLSLRLDINGVLRQQGNSSRMLNQVPELISFASRFVTFERGDLLMTGTPAGVGPVNHKDVLTCSIQELPVLQIVVVRR